MASMGRNLIHPMATTTAVMVVPRLTLMTNSEVLITLRTIGMKSAAKEGRWEPEPVRYGGGRGRGIVPQNARKHPKARLDKLRK